MHFLRSRRRNHFAAQKKVWHCKLRRASSDDRPYAACLTRPWGSLGLSPAISGFNWNLIPIPERLGEAFAEEDVGWVGGLWRRWRELESLGFDGLALYF